VLAESDLVRFRTLLESRLNELNAAFQAPDDRAQEVELDQSRVGRLSRMDALQQQAFSDAARVRAMRERARIEIAIQRWKSGEYGLCTQCEEPIALGRLEFDPTTSLCISCAHLSESG